jgi:two-component system nitrogen regulation sensor histidine kinase GlnL
LNNPQLPKLDLLQHQQTAVLLLDAQLSILYLNEAAENLFAVSLARCRGEPSATIIHLNANLELSTALTNGQPFTHRCAVIEALGVGQLTVDYSVTPIIETLPGYLLIEFQPLQRKVSIDREDARANSLETSRMLVRGLAHEIKNPLGGIRGAAQLLEAELAEPRLTEYTQVIIEEADRLRSLVDSLLGPNRPHQSAPVNIHKVLEHVVLLLAADAGPAPQISREYDPSLPRLLADEAQLIQATLNVMRNAHQALGEHATPQLLLRTIVLRQFTIGERTHRLVVRVDIQDNGPGIPPQIRDRLFLPMISGRAEGSGLGLAITQTIVNQHDGLIDVESKPGCTCFSIYLPLAP